MKVFYLHVFLIAFLLSCGSESKNKSKKNISIDSNSSFVSETFMIDDQSIPYPSDSVSIILEKAGLCMVDTTNARINNFAPCEANLFRYFANSKSKYYSNGFMVEVRPLILSKSFRIINIVKAEDGSYKISNDYAGQLLEIRTTKKGNYDMVIRYFDKKIDATVTILHKWKNYHYVPVEVLEINDYFIKENKKDSLNQVYIKDFAWGF